MTIEQEIDYLYHQILALNNIGKVTDAKNAFTTLLNYGATAEIDILKKAFNSFKEGELGKSKTELFNNVLKHREAKKY